MPGRAPSACLLSGVVAILDELESEATLDTQVAAGDVMVVRRRHLDDVAVLHVQGQVAADAAVRTDGVHLRLARLVPVASLPQLVLAREHERTGRTDGDAVAAVDARGVGQRDVELRRDAR